MAVPTRSINLPVNFYQAPIQLTATAPQRDGRLIAVDLNEAKPLRIALIHAWDFGRKTCTHVIGHQTAPVVFRQEGFQHYEPATRGEFRYDIHPLKTALLDWIKKNPPEWCAGMEEQFQMHITTALGSSKTFLVFEAPSERPSVCPAFDRLANFFI